MTDLRTPAEIAYDNLKNGSAYVKPQPLDDIQTLLDCTPYTTEADVHLLCEEQIIKGWERTDAELKEDTDLMIEVLKVRTAPAFAELEQSDYRRGWDDGLRAVFELARRRREKGAA